MLLFVMLLQIPFIVHAYTFDMCNNKIYTYLLTYLYWYVLLYSDFLQKLMVAMAANAKLALTSLNTSGNVIEEKGSYVYFVNWSITYLFYSQTYSCLN